MNYVSPLLNRNISSKSSMVPASVGKQVPNNPQDLMNQLRSLQRRRSAPRKENNASSRKLQQEQKSEMIERILMQNEDAAKFCERRVTSPADETLRMY